MLLRELIQQRFKSSFHIYNRDGILLDDELVKSEYSKIKNFLLQYHSQTTDCVAIKIQKDYHYMLIMLACMEIGVPYVPLKFDYPSDRIEQIKEDSAFTLLIDDNKLQEILNHTSDSHFDLPQIEPNSTLYTIFTSGTTGRPKGVSIQRKALENFFSFLNQNFSKVSERDKLLQLTEFTFDISLIDVGLFLLKNIEIYFSNFQNNIFKLGFEVETNRITFINTVPNNLNMFLSEFVAERMNFESLKYLSIGGARFSFGLYQKCLKYFKRDVDIYNFYGPTEATVYCHCKHITYDETDDCIEGVVSIGNCLPNVTAQIVLDDKILQPYERGELYVGGVQLLKEYVNNSEQTLKVLTQIDKETFYKTGDLAFKNEKNEFFIVGRTDETIKYRGFRINLLDIDSYITRLPYVHDAVTIATPNEATENQTISFIILKDNKSVKEVKKDLSQLLLDYQIPEKIVFVNKYPINNSGKVCRKTLTQNYIESLEKESR